MVKITSLIFILFFFVFQILTHGTPLFNRTLQEQQKRQTFLRLTYWFSFTITIFETILDLLYLNLWTNLPCSLTKLWHSVIHIGKDIRVTLKYFIFLMSGVGKHC